MKNTLCRKIKESRTKTKNAFPQLKPNYEFIHTHTDTKYVSGNENFISKTDKAEVEKKGSECNAV